MKEEECIQEERISFNFIKKENLTGSLQGMRYLLKKQEEKIVAVVWPEPYCFEITPEEEKTYAEFELTIEGKTEAVGWLNKQFQTNKEKWLEAKANAFRW